MKRKAVRYIHDGRPSQNAFNSETRPLKSGIETDLKHYNTSI